LTSWRPALLWLTEWGIWSGSENWHEAEDLASFLQVAMLNGWGGYVLTEADYVNAFFSFSHDEFIDFFAGHDENLGEVRKELGAGHQPAG